MDTVGENGNPKWLIDSGELHHVTSDLQNLSLNSNYIGDDLMYGDGKKLCVTHFGSTKIYSPSRDLNHSNVLCVPSKKKNLISIYQLCASNNVSIKFSSFSYVVKDYGTGVPLVRGKTRNGLYEWP